MALTDRHLRPIKSVQVIRGIAATAVALYHTNWILAQPVYGGQHVFDTASRSGWLGVNLFFVISGFIIFYSHQHDIGKPKKLVHYAWRRAQRIYPIYWIFLTAYIIAAALGLGYADFKWQLRHFVSAYLLVAIVDEPTLPLKVAWTLLFEVKFYVIFSSFLISRKIGIAVLVTWIAAIMSRNSIAPPPDWGLFVNGWGLLNVWNLYFVMGIITCWSFTRISNQNGPWLLFIGLVLLGTLVSTMHGDMYSDVRNPFLQMSLGLAFSLIILGAVACELRYAWQPPNWAIFLGNASYSIYLVHSAFISIAASIVFKHFNGIFPGSLVFSSIFVGAIASGLIAHLIIERPLISLLGRLGPDVRKLFSGRVGERSLRLEEDPTGMKSKFLRSADSRHWLDTVADTKTE